MKDDVSKQFSARITGIRQETPTVKSFVLDYGSQEFTYLPGQWIDLYVETQEGMAVGGYSMTSSPAQHGHFSLAIKQGTRHPVTRHMYEHAHVGDLVSVSNGQGVFVFEQGMTSRIVLVGAGVGLTPLMSILRYVHGSAPEVSATLVYSIPSPEEYLFRDEIEGMVRDNPNIRALVTVTQDAPKGWSGRTGRISEQMLREAGTSDDTLYYLCGPQQMIEDVVKILQGMGIPDTRIVYEKWW
jgi:ferredoxin-NADP reductase